MTRSAVSTYAPYLTHVLTVELFFQIALAAGLISSERPSNRIDIAYLFYLPFSMIFVSSDKLHRACSHHFLRQDQEFIWGEDLKADLKKINEFYSKFPESEKEKGIMHFASRPPARDDFLVSQLWSGHLRPLDDQIDIDQIKSVTKKEIADSVVKFHKAPTMKPNKVVYNTEEADVVSIERRVKMRKGSWWQVPKDIEKS